MANYHSFKVATKDIVDWADKVIGADRKLEQTLWKLVMEEIPELAQEYNKTGELDKGEVGDVLILVLDLCHLAGIDASEAIAEKMEVNKQRTWKAGHSGIMSHE